MTDNKKRRVVVTGLGPVSPIAIGKKDYWQALCMRAGTESTA